MTIELIGVPFDGMGRPGGQAAAPAALRAVGLVEALGSRVGAQVEVPVPPPDGRRSHSGGLLNEESLLAMVDGTRQAVADALSRGQFPLVYGGDCAALLGAVPALAQSAGTTGLLFLDGHEDATPVERSTTGEAANMEVAILTGLTGPGGLPPRLEPVCGVLSPECIAVLGPRDAAYRDPLGVPSVRDRFWFRDADDLARSPRRETALAVGHLSAATSDWWLHVDLDVLSGSAFTSCGAPGEPALPGGLTWGQLTEAVGTALEGPGCRGWSLGVYNPDLDRDGDDARTIVEMVAAVTARMPARRRT